MASPYIAGGKGKRILEEEEEESPSFEQISFRENDDGCFKCSREIWASRDIFDCLAAG
jgi:hypothetical protein